LRQRLLILRPTKYLSPLHKNEVSRWKDLVSSGGRKGVSTAELIDLLSMINEPASQIFVKESKLFDEKLQDHLVKEIDVFISCTRPKLSHIFSIFDQTDKRGQVFLRCYWNLSMKIRLRQAIALYTSHSEIPNSWEGILNYSFSKIDEMVDHAKTLVEKYSIENQKLVIHNLSV
jgi:hypothetical protein